MSFGEASACAAGFAGPVEVDCWANEAIDSHGQMMANEATITKGIRIPESISPQGRQGEIDPCRLRPSSLSEREHNQGTGIFRHALEGFAIERDKLVGHQAAPARRYGNVLLATGHVADDAG